MLANQMSLLMMHRIHTLLLIHMLRLKWNVHIDLL